MGDINWDVELKKIERDFSGLPAAPTTAQRQAKQSADRRVQQQRDAATAKFGATARLVLVAGLFGALFLWPYQRDCGVGLFGYMAVQVVMAAGALSIAVYTWQHRIARVHVAAFTIFIVAIGLITAQVLPRVGYVKAGTPAQQWWCVSR
jgi:hypothetical protein